MYTIPTYYGYDGWMDMMYTILKYIISILLYIYPFVSYLADYYHDGAGTIYYQKNYSMIISVSICICIITYISSICLILAPPVSIVQCRFIKAPH